MSHSSFLMTVYSPTRVVNVGAKGYRCPRNRNSSPARPLKFNTTEAPEREVSIHFYHPQPSILANSIIKRTEEGTWKAHLFRSPSGSDCRCVSKYNVEIRDTQSPMRLFFCLFLSFLRAWQIQRGNKAREEQSRHRGASVPRANDSLSNRKDELRLTDPQVAPIIF